MLKIIHTPTASGAVLRIDGDLDFRTTPQFREALNDVALDAGERLVLDLAGLRFCDSSGITAFLAARNHAVAAGADVALAAVPDNTVRILRVVGLDQIFTIEEPDRA
ncbi:MULTISPECIES: STAS domain-containing protein [unclassified Streptomyces]|jgi:anti-anti-sigma factor|uniref:STAS domain-containing protein n=1 Tax=unclassified Streptomyces TaxID=2593676 RepID=UPI0004CB039D|nr:STAS domain-containing protein [Streptomyces sp. NRRL S-118]